MRRKTLPPAALASWAKLNNVTFNGVHIEYSDDGRGYGARSVRKCQIKRGEPLLLVPSDLILSVDAVHNQAKVDRYLAELLTAAEDLSKVRTRSKSSTQRGDIGSFLRSRPGERSCCIFCIR